MKKIVPKQIMQTVILLFFLSVTAGCEENFDPYTWNGVIVSGNYEGTMTILIDGYNLVSGQSEELSSMPIAFSVAQNGTVKISINYDTYYTCNGESYVVNMQSTINDIEAVVDSGNDRRVLLSAENPSASCVITEEICVISSLSGYVDADGTLRVELSGITNSDRTVESVVDIILSAGRVQA